MNDINFRVLKYILISILVGVIAVLMSFLLIFKTFFIIEDEIIEDEAKSDITVSGGLIKTICTCGRPCTKPSEGQVIMWLTDGTDEWEEGSLIVAATVDGVTKTYCLFDFSSGDVWNGE